MNQIYTTRTSIFTYRTLILSYVGGAGANPPTTQNRIARNIYFCEIFIELQKSIIKILCHNIDLQNVSLLIYLSNIIRTLKYENMMVRQNSKFSSGHSFYQSCRRDNRNASNIHINFYDKNSIIGLHLSSIRNYLPNFVYLNREKFFFFQIENAHFDLYSQHWIFKNCKPVFAR